MKRIFVLYFAVMLATQAWAQTTFTVGSLKYTVTDTRNHYVSVAKGSTEIIGDLEIPETVEKNGVTFTVTSIPANAFSNCKNITSVIIPNTVLSIGKGAFSGCSYLIMMHIPFVGNERRSSSNQNPYPLGYIFGTTGYAQSEETKQKGVGYYIPTSLKTVIVTDSEYIPDRAFENCNMLQAILIANTVTTVGSSAFNGCSGLKYISIPSSVTSISNDAFNGTPAGRNSVIIFDGSNLLTFNYQEHYLFNINVTVDKKGFIFFIGKLANEDVADGEVLLAYVGADKDIDIPNTVKFIVSLAGYGKNQFLGVESITIPGSVKLDSEFGEELALFHDCSTLTEIHVDNDNENYSSEDGVLYNKDKTVLLFCPTAKSGACLISNSVTYISPYAFYMCNNLQYNESNNACYLGSTENPYLVLIKAKSNTITSCEVCNNCRIIHREAFKGCTEMESVFIPQTVESIGPDAFYNCTGLTKAVFENIESICGIKFLYEGPEPMLSSNPLTYAHHLYINQEEITSLVIPDEITKINSMAFAGCSYLKYITIPNSVTSIGDYAFYDVNLIIYSGNATGSPWGAKKVGVVCDEEGLVYADTEKTQLVGYMGNATSITVPNSVTSIGEKVFWDCSSLTSVSIPESVTSIRNYAFEGCSSLIAIAYDGTNEPTMGTDVFKNANHLEKVCVPEIYSSNSFGGLTICNGLVHDNVTEPTCIETGLTEGVHCANCDRVFVAQEVIPINNSNHNYSAPTYEWGEGNSTCTATKVCANDNEHIVTETVNATSAVTVATTCEAVGTRTFTAEFADEGFATQQTTEEIPATGHKEVVDAAVAATCTAAGKTEGKHCEVCNTVFVAQEDIPALGHDFKTYKFDNNATTETDGTETAMCEHGCGTTDTRTAAGTKIATTPEKGTAVAESAANAISIYTCNNVIVVENATDEIRVYDAMGRMICRDAINRVRAEIPVNTAGLYIVRVGNVAKRVMINE